MRNFARFLVNAAGLSLAILSTGRAVAATECSGTLSATVTTGVVVNAGDTCVLSGANVYGGVLVNNGGRLIACGSIIYGGIRSDGAARILIGPEELPNCKGDTIYGGIRIRNSGPSVIPGPPSVGIENSIVDGGIHLTGNIGRLVIANNNINGGMFCKDNKSDPGDEGKPSFVTGAITCVFNP